MNRAAALSRLIRERRHRASHFDVELFREPAWDILLDLAHASATGRRLSITAVCIGSGVPWTTALRWIGTLTGHGLVEREDDPDDRRRGWLALTEAGRDAMDDYLAGITQRAAA
jgi:DNA-binding MarR family transcriptional regulator